MSCGIDLCPAGTVGGIAVPEATVAMRGGAYYAQQGTSVEPYGCSLAVGQKGGACPCMRGGCGSCLNSLFGSFSRRGGYQATKRDKAALKKWRAGKSIGFTMRSSLKAKGLIKRANGTKRVSAKYRNKNKTRRN